MGNILEKDRRKFEHIDSVYVTGSVTSIVGEVREAIAGVCPMRFGAGMQNKVLEYMALGLPTITSSMGLEGIDAVPGHQLLVASTPEDYEYHLNRLYNDIEYATNLSKEGRLFVEKNHAWQIALSPLIKQVDKILGLS